MPDKIPPEYVGRIRQAYNDYFTIADMVGYKIPPMPQANFDHSALLGRLIEGSPIYKFAPPRAMSYPWYDLLDTGKATAYVSLPPNPKPHWYPWDLAINQCGEWKIEKVVKEREEYVAFWPHYKLRVLLKNTGVNDEWNVEVLETENVTVKNAYHVERITKAP